MSEEKTQITLQDFSFVVNIINVCTERGAFRGDELLPVGQLRNKFINFINENKPKEQPAVEDKTEEETP